MPQLLCRLRGTKTFLSGGAITMLITMQVSEALPFWALALTTAYSVVAFVGYLGLVYASPAVNQNVLASELAIDEDAQRKRGALVQFIPRRAKIPVEGQALEWAA
jgi:hypothetical protein